jgi:glucokinase
MNSELVIGIDIGGTGIQYGICESSGKVLRKGNLKTLDYPEPGDFVNEFYRLLEPEMTLLSNDYVFKGIGIGAPNGNYYTGSISYAPNLTWKGDIPLAKMISQKFSMPALLTNDANAAAIGEMKFGAARGMKDFIMITLGTGVGSGIVCNGQLILGHDGFAGELGHITVIPGGRLHPGTGMRGALECYASASGVVTSALELLESSREASILRNINDKSKIESKDIYNAAVQGDTIALRTFYETGKLLGESFANFIMFTSPEAIILFGGLTKAGDLLLLPAREHMEKNLLPIFRGKVKLMVSQLNESEAAILGAAALIWDRY